jgi:hypothetical protein
MFKAKIILINSVILLLLATGILPAQNIADTSGDTNAPEPLVDGQFTDQNELEVTKDALKTINLKPKITETPREYLFSLGAPLWYDFKTADDGERFVQRAPIYGVTATIQYRKIGGIGFEYYEVPIANHTSETSVEKDRIVFAMIDLIYTVSVIPNPFNMAVGIGYGKTEVQGSNASKFNKGECYQWFLRGGLNLNEKLQIYMEYHDVYSKIPFKDNEDYGIEAGGFMYLGGASIAF